MCAQAEWVGISFELGQWKNTGGSVLKGGSVDEAQILLDDHAIKSQAMLSSPFAKPFHDRISIWTVKLSRMQDIFDQWLTCQVSVGRGVARLMHSTPPNLVTPELSSAHTRAL